MRRSAFVFVAPFLLATALHASPQPPPAPAPQGGAAPKTQPPTAEKPPAPPPQETYSYQPQGRRDPFLNLLGTGTEPRMAGKRGEGPASMTVGEISVRGVLQSRGALVAMITGPDGKTYVVHQGDKLADGTIKAITPQGLVIVQEVNDPLSLVKQREITKLLRALEVAKE